MKLKSIRFASLTVLALAFLVTMATMPAVAAEPMVGAEKLETMAKNAKTPGEHAAVAKQFRLRAESFAAKAEKHEAEARKLANGPRIGIDAKWPAMARNTAAKEKQLAMEARRAAQENYALADQHIRFVIEKEFAEE